MAIDNPDWESWNPYPVSDEIDIDTGEPITPTVNDTTEKTSKQIFTLL